MHVTELKLCLEDRIDPESLTATLAFLNQHNEALGLEYRALPLAVFLKDKSSTIRGGLTGSTNWEWLRIDILAVDAALRGQGWGARLMEMAEEEAKRRGCHHAFVDTYSFQALPFYKAQGYVVFGELADYPTGHARLFLQKALA